MNVEERAMTAAKAVADFNGLSEEIKNLLHTQYVVAAADEAVLHEGDEGTFGQAVESLKFGRKVARKGWNGKGMFLWLKPFALVKSEWCKDPKLKEIADRNGGEIQLTPDTLSTRLTTVTTLTLTAPATLTTLRT